MAEVFDTVVTACADESMQDSWFSHSEGCVVCVCFIYIFIYIMGFMGYRHNGNYAYNFLSVNCSLAGRRAQCTVSAPAHFRVMPMAWHRALGNGRVATPEGTAPRCHIPSVTLHDFRHPNIYIHSREEQRVCARRSLGLLRA